MYWYLFPLFSENARKSRNVFSANGHPMWRKNATIAGLSDSNFGISGTSSPSFNGFCSELDIDGGIIERISFMVHGWEGVVMKLDDLFQAVWGTGQGRLQNRQRLLSLNNISKGPKSDSRRD